MSSGVATRGRRCLLSWGLAALALLVAPPAAAQETVRPQEEPGPLRDIAEPGERAVITAEELVYDEGLDTVTARGDVEIRYGGRILLADTVSYQIQQDRATASGNVTLLEPDGTTLFSDYVELTGELKEGYAREVRLLLADGSRAGAREAFRTGGNRTELATAVYTACDPCEDPERPPVWQIKAMRVIHDQEEREVTYRNAWLELFGVPIAYTPWLTHPDPTVERRSGFLAPTYGGTQDLGVTVTVPYYYTFSPSHDLTVAPMFTSDEGIVLGGEHRIVGERGALVSEGSITQDSEGRVRNHINAEAQYIISETWRTGADVALTSDDTYLRRYGFESPAFLTTRGYLQGFSRRSYATVESYYFQNLTDENGLVQTEDPPVVAPLAEWYLVTAPGPYGQYQTGVLSTAVLQREDGASSRRLSADWGWHLPYVSPNGAVYRLDASLRGDVYHVSDVPRAQASSFTGFTGRVVPEVALTWSLPMERSHPTFHEIIEPIVMGVVSPRGQNPEKIPNEDSLDFEFDDTNLFSTNRFAGWDRIEGGARVNYGLRWGAFGSRLGHVEALVGQSYRASANGLFAEGSGLENHFSDYVGRLLLRPGPNFNVLYRFRLDKDEFEMRRNELAATVGPPPLRLTTSYIGITGRPLSDGGPEELEELAVSLNSEISRYWRAGVSTRYDLTPDGGPLSIGGRVEYEDECFIFAIDGEREYTYDRDFEGGYSVAVRLVFKSLGTVQTSTEQ